MLPVLEKTWQFNVNQTHVASGGAEEDHRQVLYNVHAAQVAFATLPWTVAGSSDAVTAGMDAVDRWTAPSKLDWGTGPASTRSWIVYDRVGGDQLLLDLDSNSGTFHGTRMVIGYSPGGLYTGGSVTAKPTATDETILANNGAAWLSGFNTSQSYAWHTMHSTDGKSTWWIFNYSGLTTNIIGFVDLEDPVTGLTKPTMITMRGASVGATAYGTYSNLFDSITGFVKGIRNDNTLFNAVMTSEHLLSTVLGEVINANDFSTEYHLTPIRMGSNVAGARGSHGRVPDIYAGAASLGQGDTYPAAVTRDWATFGVLVFPWPTASGSPVTA